MKMWRLCLVALICSGLCVPIGLSGCGDDNPCDEAEPSICATIQYAIPDGCLVVRDDDFACNCCAPDVVPCDVVTGNPADDDLETGWHENTKTCQIAE